MDWWSDALRTVVAGRDVVLAGAVPAAWRPTVDALRDAGVGRILVLATEGRGVGARPDGVAAWEGERPEGGTMDVLRAGLRALRQPPAGLLDALRAFDPDRRALVIGTFLADIDELDGRPLLAHRRSAWLALEDKLVADDIWDRAGVARCPSTIVPLGDAPRSWAALDDGAGTVWAADARDGFHGGATLVRWVTDAGEADEARMYLGAHCDRVRIMPFVEGVPCSVHGIVLPDGVVTLRPVEMVTLRRGHEFVYAGCATFHDPLPSVREEMRRAARAVGELLRHDVGFRGAFTVDGVAGAEGFRPTELNPRFGAGLNVVARGVGDVPLTLLNDLVVAGVPLGRTAADWEAELLVAADAQRWGGTWRACDARAAVEDRPLVVSGDAWRDARPGEEPHAHVSVGARFARVTFAAAATPTGPSVAPRAAAFWDWAAAHIGAGTQLAGLTAAIDHAR
jgi:hypothetical protein